MSLTLFFKFGASHVQITVDQLYWNFVTALNALPRSQRVFVNAMVRVFLVTFNVMLHREQPLVRL